MKKLLLLCVSITCISISTIQASSSSSSQAHQKDQSNKKDKAALSCVKTDKTDIEARLLIMEQREKEAKEFSARPFGIDAVISKTLSEDIQNNFDHYAGFCTISTSKADQDKYELPDSLVMLLPTVKKQEKLFELDHLNLNQNADAFLKLGWNFDSKNTFLRGEIVILPPQAHVGMIVGKLSLLKDLYLVQHGLHSNDIPSLRIASPARIGKNKKIHIFKLKHFAGPERAANR